MKLNVGEVPEGRGLVASQNPHSHDMGQGFYLPLPLYEVWILDSFILVNVQST